MNTYKEYFELLSSLEDLDQTVSGDIINKLVEAGCLTTVLEVKEKFRYVTSFSEDKHLLPLSFCILVTSKCVPWQTVETHIKCHIMGHFIRVYNVC